MNAREVKTAENDALRRFAALIALLLVMGCGPNNAGNRKPPRVRRPHAEPSQELASSVSASETANTGSAASPPQSTGDAAKPPTDAAGSATSSDQTQPPPRNPTLPLPPQQGPKEIPPPIDLYEDAELKWVSDFGPGGMTIPRLPEPSPAEDEGLTHLVGVVFPEGTRDVLFIGRREPGYETISTEDLLNAFTVAYRAAGAGSPPGVSIDPRSGQLQGGLREGDLMDVVYFGGVQNSEYGFAAFEADRLMKCLSAGKDNLSGDPVSSSVPGYRSELELYAEGVDAQDAAWHRFWIEIDKSDVAHSGDHRALMAVVKLAVRTEYMEVAGGELVSGDRPPDPVARYFATHLTDHYAAYGKEFPVFNRLAAFATLTSVAAAIRDDAANPVRREIDEEWRLDEHVLPPRETPTTTPVVIATHGRAQLSGGVKLEPKNQNHLDHPRAQDLQKDVLASLPAHPHGGAWPVTSQGVQYQVVSARPRRARRTWQEDLAVGDVRLVRENGPRDAQGKSTPGWSFRLPRLRLDDELVSYQGAGKGPKAAYVYDDQGRPVELSQFGKLTMPGNPPTPGYGDASDSRNLYMYSNGWMYLEGDIEFVSINGGSPAAQLGPGARVIEFSPREEDGHRVESVQTAQGKTLYEYDGERLSRIRNDQGEAVRFDYDSLGRLSRAIGSDGQSISYNYDDQGRLVSLANSQGARLAYLYGEGLDAPFGVRAELRQNPAADYQPAAQALIETPDRSTPEYLLSDPRARHIAVEPASDSSGGYVLTIRGKGLSAAIQERLAGTATATMLGELAQRLRSLTEFAGAEVVLITGPSDVSNRVAGALRSPDLPDLRVFSASSPALADANLHRPPALNRQVRTVVHTDRMQPQVAAQLPRSNDSSLDAGVVLLIGHNTASFSQLKYDMAARGEFVGRNVIVLACPSVRTPGEDDNALRAHGAVSVTGLGQPISQALLPYFVPAVVNRIEQLQTNDSAPMRKDQSLEKALREAADEVEQLWKEGKLPAAIQENEIKNLRLIYERVGKLDRNRLRGSPTSQENQPHKSQAA